MMSLYDIEVFVNGERFQVPSDGNVLSLLDHLKIKSDRVAVELNKTLVRRRDWGGTKVADGARVEIVEFVGGG